MYAAIVRTDATVTFVEDKPKGIAAINAAVGGYFDVVGTAEASVFVNDEGLLIGLPVNIIASAIAGQILVGDAFIAGPVDNEGETLAISARLVELLRQGRTATLAGI